ncbi:MAG: hypothetical protein D3920_10680, partial [Candidatus Electrothrix sp. AW2]|nr:hypothetical protein [Candidatus Electrothrix gigas]
TVIRWQPAQKSDQIFLLKDTTLFAHCKYFFAIDQKVMVAKVEVDGCRNGNADPPVELDTVQEQVILSPNQRIQVTNKQTPRFKAAWDNRNANRRPLYCSGSINVSCREGCPSGKVPINSTCEDGCWDRDGIPMKLNDIKEVKDTVLGALFNSSCTITSYRVQCKTAGSSPVRISDLVQRNGWVTTGRGCSRYKGCIQNHQDYDHGETWKVEKKCPPGTMQAGEVYEVHDYKCENGSAKSTDYRFLLNCNEIIP